VSLEIIGKRAFYYCDSLRHLTFAERSQLWCIQKEAFTKVPLERVILPATVKEVDPSAFTLKVWGLLQSPLLVTDGFILSADSRILFARLSPTATVVIPALSK
jgi:hypothetical protein